MSELVAFIAGHRAEFIARLGEHVILVFVSTAVAAAIGIPLGIVAARRPSIAKPIVAIANLAQTIPSLALFGFLIPLPLVGGIGTRTALVALTVYAVLPDTSRSTITGVQGVAEPVIECAVAMGLTPRQILTQVEWPLALPSIVSGLRVAVVIGVGTATIASAIGAGGLGDYIFRGLAMVDSTVILAGAVPAALLALVCDAALAVAGRIADPRRRSRRAAVILAVIMIGATAAAVWASGLANRRDVIVGSKNFTEQIVLGRDPRAGHGAARRQRRAPIQPWRHGHRAPGTHQRRHRRLCRVFRHVAHRHFQPAAIDGFERGASRRFAIAMPRSASPRCRGLVSTTPSRSSCAREDAERMGLKTHRRSQQVRRRERRLWLRVPRTPGRIHGVARRLRSATRGPAADHGSEPDLPRGGGA